MKRFLLIFVLGVFMTTSYAVDPSTPNVVKQFYKAMEELQYTHDDNSVWDLRETMQKCFLYGDENVNKNRGENSGIPISNDFFELGYDDRGKTISSTLYAHIFSIKSQSNPALRAEIKIGESMYAYEPEFKNFRTLEIPSIRTISYRTFILGSQKLTFTDTIWTQNNQILAMRNGVYIDDPENLREVAKSYFTEKKYKLAYETYQKIITRDPTNANAFYRLGILSFWYGKKCGFRTNKEGQTAGKEFMKKAKDLRFSRAEQVLYYMRDWRVEI